MFSITSACKNVPHRNSLLLVPPCMILPNPPKTAFIQFRIIKELEIMANTSRPNVSVQTMRYVQSKQCIHIDGYLFNHLGALYFRVDTCLGGRSEMSLGVFVWELRKDSFGLYGDIVAQGVPDGAQLVNARNLAGLNSAQYRQLCRLMTLLCMAVRSRFKLPRHSTVIWALAPIAGDPFADLPNHYVKTGRAVRDAKAAKAKGANIQHSATIEQSTNVLD